ncbi:glycosyltransferase [Parachaetomium inaequale]|uniref:Glycosyltransferase n=1 Tax=Parachaetomium inaequale TaxID=2588326 RepID=A0AAN6PCV6_9PEZI|nr:glycosyltransferase [Parachaetomium inaequale]
MDQKAQGSVAFLRHVSRKVFILGGKARVSAAVILLFASAYLIYRLYFYDDFYVPARVPGRHSSNHAPPSGWWVEFFTRLESTRVTARSIKIKDWGPAINWKPDTDAARPDLVKLRRDDEAWFRESHASFIDQLAPFASHLPYGANTTGIVTTAGVANFGQAISLVLTTRRAGSLLPIQIFLDSSSPWVDLVCAETMPRYNATCLSLGDAWAGIDRLVPKFVRFQWKVISIIASTFQNVLFLDADCLPVLNPDTIFDQGSEPFTSAGLITWPDFWTSTTSSLFYKVAGNLDIPPLTSRPTSESGMLVFDKARHADTLLLAAYYNYNGPKHYYPLLSQHAAGEGDKETFLQAALVLEALRQQQVYQQPTAWMKPGVGVKKGYYDVKKLPTVHGRSARGKWTGMFLLQMDPMEDYRAVTAAIDKATKKGPEAKLRPETRQQSGQEPPPPPPRTSHRRDGAEAIVEEDFLTNSAFLAIIGNLLPEDLASRTMFFHHSGVKPDFTRILDKKWGLVETDEAGKYVRLWGHAGWIVDTFGRDVEKQLWEDSMGVYCQEELAQFARLRKVCAQMRVIYEQVYG